MGRNKQIRARIKGLERQVRAHQAKIRRELNKKHPDLGLIRHWQKEIEAWQRQLERLKSKLPGGK